jgi:hypothetical protein
MSYPYYGMIIGNVYLLLVIIRRIAGEPPPREALPPEIIAP